MCSNDSDRSNLMAILKHWTGYVPFSPKSVLSHGESALLHNLLWLSSHPVLSLHDSCHLWKRALRWPHSILKAEPFITQHSFALYSKGHYGIVKGMTAAVRSAPELRRAMLEGLVPSTLIIGKSKTIGVKMESNSDKTEWFYGPFDAVGSQKFSFGIHSFGALKALVLARSSETFEPVVWLALNLLSLELDSASSFSSAHLMAHLENCVQVTIEWALSSTIPRQYLQKCWEILYSLLLNFPKGHYAIDLLIGAISRQIDRLFKRPANYADALLAITQCVLWMTSIDSKSYQDCMMKLADTGDCRIIELICIQYDTECIDDRIVKSVAHGLFSKDGRIAKRVAETIGRSQGELAKCVPWPLDDLVALQRAVQNSFWTSVIIDYVSQDHSIVALVALSRATHLEPADFNRIVSIMSDKIVEGKLEIGALERVLKCNISNGE